MHLINSIQGCASQINHHQRTFSARIELQCPLTPLSERSPSHRLFPKMQTSKMLALSARCTAIARPFSRAKTVTVQAERLRLGNLSPAEGAHRDKKRKGRGTAAGQGDTCGFGERGQKSRSGPSVRPGFEGGQTPLYRRLPKLRGIAGGMGAGQPDHVLVNVQDLNKFEAGTEVTLDLLKEKGVVKVTGRERKLPLKVLGGGELKAGVSVKAAAFSESAKSKIEAAGGQAVVVKKLKWSRWRKTEDKKAAEAAQ